MKECKECGGTGLVTVDKYCKCYDGKLLKIMDEAAAKKTAAIIADAANVEKMQQEEKRKLHRIPLLVGDWVEITGVTCVVTEINEYNNYFTVESIPRKGERPKIISVTYRGQTPMPLERFDDPGTLRQLVDMALMFKDENWFNELSGGAK